MTTTATTTAAAAAIRKALVVGVTNKHSIGWAITKKLLAQNYEVCIAHQPRFRRNIDSLVASSSSKKNISTVEYDAEEEEVIIRSSGRSLLDGKMEKLDALVHAVAFAPTSAMKGTMSCCFSETNYADFELTNKISVYSLLQMVQVAKPLLLKGDKPSVVALSYLGGNRAIKSYNIMGPAKAQLEACVRQLALELGTEDIRVNAVSAGPVRTVSSRGISNFSSVLSEYEQRSPLKRNVSADEVANVTAFLVGCESSAVTGQTIYVDGGYSSVAGPP